MNRIMILVALIIIAAFGICTAGGLPCWYSDSDGFSEHKDCLERRGNESLQVKRFHLASLNFNGNLAIVYGNTQGWMYVNTQGKVVVSGVYPIDNGPDNFHNGFVRFERKGKSGYATVDGRGSIMPQFDGCEAFEDGKARVCNGCRTLPVDSTGEYHELKGGEWFCINTKGKRIACAP
jgi:hypothetical protein